LQTARCIAASCNTDIYTYISVGVMLAEYLVQPSYSPSFFNKRSGKFFILNKIFTKLRRRRRMATPFFIDDWEKIAKEELDRSRARLSGFIEATTDKDRLIRDVSIPANPNLNSEVPK
jgi:hypothetical protein